MSYTIDDLKTLMARLRDPETGCPWDTRQTYGTIVPHTIEEAYEVADAIDRGDYPHLKDELGDLLFVCVNLARFMKVNPEQALKRTNHKFETRFRAIEQVLAQESRDMDEESLEALDAIWQAVKGVERDHSGH